MDWDENSNPRQPNGCAWYRCVLPSIQLQKYGWETNVALPEFHKDYGFGAYIGNDQVQYGWNIVVFKLVMSGIIADILENREKTEQKVVVDVDDFFEELPITNFAYSTTDPENYPDNNRNHYYRILNSADAIITSTQFLYDFYTKEKGMKNVYLVRNGIDIDRWHKKTDHSRWMPTVGWVGAIPWRSNDLETMSTFLGQFLQENRLNLHHSGHIKGAGPDFVDLAQIPSTVKFTHEPRKILSQYPQLFKKIDIGLVPLNNIRFNYAKSSIKGLEYAASGIPFIASWSPEYEYLANDGVGRVAKNEEEWLYHLNDLLDPKTRKEDADKNYEIVKQRHTVAARAGDWNNVMQSILDL